MQHRPFGRLKDPISGLTHLAGALLGMLALVYLVLKAIDHGTIWHIVSFSIFGGSLILLYTSSTFYHLLDISDKARIVFRKIDHTMIFVLIAGSYTPFCLVSLHGTWGWSIFTVVWGIAVLGFFLKFYWIHAPRWLSTALYLGMGWLIVVALLPLSRTLTHFGLLWLGIGGMFYTVGAIIYALKRPDPFPNIFGFHEIWHLFVLAGSASHFVSISSIL